jgi:hypothetical protein
MVTRRDCPPALKGTGRWTSIRCIRTDASRLPIQTWPGDKLQADALADQSATAVPGDLDPTMNARGPPREGPRRSRNAGAWSSHLPSARSRAIVEPCIFRSSEKEHLAWLFTQIYCEPGLYCGSARCARTPPLTGPNTPAPGNLTQRADPQHTTYSSDKARNNPG